MEPVKTLMMMVGLPRSGKTTWALMTGHPIVSPDSIRLALYGQAYVASAERVVWAIAHYMVKALFLAGHDTVILDACNNATKHRDEWKSPDWDRQFVVIDTPQTVCLSRVYSTDPNAAALKHMIVRMTEEHQPVNAILEEGQVVVVRHSQALNV